MEILYINHCYYYCYYYYFIIIIIIIIIIFMIIIIFINLFDNLTKLLCFTFASTKHHSFSLLSKTEICQW